MSATTQVNNKQEDADQYRYSNTRYDHLHYVCAAHCQRLVATYHVHNTDLCSFIRIKCRTKLMYVCTVYVFALGIKPI